MYAIGLVAAAILVATTIMLLMGTKLRTYKGGIRVGFRTYSTRDIACHRFLLKLCHKSPAEYASQFGAQVPWMGAPPSHRSKWIVELEVFDADGRHVRRHLFQRSSKGGAEKLAMELSRSLAPQLMAHTGGEEAD